MIRLFRVFIPARTLVLLISEMLLVAGAFVLACYLVLAVPYDYLIYEGGLTGIALVTLSILAALYLHDLYSQIQVKSRVVLLQQLCLVMGIAFLFEGLISYLDPFVKLPIAVMLLGSALAVIGIFVWRILFSTYAYRVMIWDRLLLVGGSPVLGDIGRYAEDHPESGLKVAGFVGDDPTQAACIPAGKLLGAIGSLPEIVRTTNPSRVVVGMVGAPDPAFASELLDLRFAGHVIEDAATVYEAVSGRVSVNGLRPAQLIYPGGFGPPSPNFLLYQSGLNAVMSVAGILICSPLMLIAALVLRVSSPGPIIERQQRIGLNGRLFTMYRFRRESSGPARTVRRLHLEGLPRLFNVLKGDMSIVGPRPERPEYVAELDRLIPFYTQRHSIRPGITGWAQVKSQGALEETLTRLEYDLYYLKNMSLTLDTFIIFHTLKSRLFSGF
jgi:lipopolysaccharide/colanic/teichoic acid biosynthesis glycosyltransferase